MLIRNNLLGIPVAGGGGHLGTIVTTLEKGQCLGRGLDLFPSTLTLIEQGDLAEAGRPIKTN